MNTEQAWKTWWDAEGKHMERLPHHDAVDHMASVTRIAWLNGAFESADEIERLQRESRERELQRDHARYLYLREIAHSDAAMMRDEARMRGWVLDIHDTAPLEPMRDA